MKHPVTQLCSSSCPRQRRGKPCHLHSISKEAVNFSLYWWNSASNLISDDSVLICKRGQRLLSFELMVGTREQVPKQQPELNDVFT
jgi:hypothetical protein